MNGLLNLYGTFLNMNPRMIPRISIIIRTLNEERYLRKLLEGIKGQLINDKIEVILIDSGSEDNTLKIASENNCKIFKIKREEFSFGRSLNLGCEKALGDIFVFISGHCVPCDNKWLEKLVDPIKKGVVDYSYGRQVGGPKTYFSENKIFEKYFPRTSQIPQNGFFCNNANSSLRKEIWLKHRFNESLTGLEDMYLAKKIVQRGGRIGYVSDAVIYHYHNENWQQVKRRFEREAIALNIICPEITINKRHVFKYIFSSIVNDTLSLKIKEFSYKNFKEIFFYRINQYLGSHKGNKINRNISDSIRDSYFYPSGEKGQPFSTNLNCRESKEINKINKNNDQKFEIIALLPMKKNSSRVVGKNFKNFSGKPLFYWVLETLLEVELIDQIIINTDAMDILENHRITNRDKILIRNRAKNICGDSVSMNKVLEDDIKNSKGKIYFMTHTTNPLLSYSTIVNALNIFKKKFAKGEIDSLFSVNKIQTRFYRNDGSPINHNPKKLIPTQELESWYEENSNFYIFTPESFKKNNSRIGNKPYLYVSPKNESIDIDEEEDWNIAEELMFSRINR